MEIERFGIGVAVLPWRFCMTEFGTAVVPCLAMICDEICFFPFYLAIYRVFSMEFGMCHFTWQFVTVVRYLSYLAPSRGAVCDTAVIDDDTGLRRIGVYIV